jgi:pyruvate,orthophosphate dikinase
MERMVYLFEDGDRSMAAVLGGKGANLAEMTRAGFPVPPGFTVTTGACNAFHAGGSRVPDGLWDEVDEAVAHLEKESGKQLGSVTNPLLVSVRSGAPISMPGMMDTILNLGLNHETTEGLASLTGDPAFAWEAYRRFIRMFAEIVFGVPADPLDHAMERAVEGNGGALDEAGLRALVDRMQRIIRGYAHRSIPSEPIEQLRLAIQAVFNSWQNRRAVDYRTHNGIPHDLGTAVNVQMMVFGNAAGKSATGVSFTRNPASGEPGLYGEYLPDAQGEDIVAGVRTPHPVAELAETMPGRYDELVEHAARLERHYTDMQDIEWTIESDTLYLLQTRRGKRTGRAAVRIAVDMEGEGLIDRREAVLRVEPQQLEQLLHPIVDPDADVEIMAKGLPASPGAASGRVVFDADEAVALAAGGDPVILVRHETSPDDFHGMTASAAIVTSRGGVTSHAAVVARGMGKCCVAGAGDLDVDYAKQQVSAGEIVVRRGDWLTVDGNAGVVIPGRVATIQPTFDDHFETLMSWADEYRTLRVRTNADTPNDATVARRFGAQGIGLCRTEHMFFGDERIAAVRSMIMSRTTRERAEALARLEPYQVEDFVGIFEAMDGLPVTIRLLDPPLHEFLPPHEELTTELTDLKLRLASAPDLAALDEILGRIAELNALIEQVERLSEENPMLGHRGCRLGNAYPEVTEMQTRAIFTAAVRCAERGIDVQPQVMVPLVGFSGELEHQEEIIRRVADEVLSQAGLDIGYHVGTMIELPRAALVADQLARTAEFFSFGTNDLTQTALGMSRDDAGRFLPSYVEQGILPEDPFRSIDIDGVGELVSLAAERGRRARADIELGICGEHGGDPATIEFMHRLGLEYVSCSPYRVPVARLAAAHAALDTGEPTALDGE